MLENEPQDSLGQGGDPDGVSTPSGEAAATSTPVRRTRAPRRKATAASAAPAGTPEAAVVTGQPGAEPGAAIEAEATAAPVKATRSRRKKAVPADNPAAVAESLLSDAEPTATATAAGSPAMAAAAPARTEPAPTGSAVTGFSDPAVTASGSTASEPASTGSDAAETGPPVKATRSRRKKAAPAATEDVAGQQAAAGQPPAATDQPTEVEQPAAVTGPVADTTGVTGSPADAVDEDGDEEAGTPVIGVLPLDDTPLEEPPAPVTRSRRRAAALPPAVLFMPPDPGEAEVPARRSRRGTAVAPGGLEAQGTAPAGSTAPADSTAFAGGTALADSAAPAEIVAPAAAEEQTETGRKPSRRRRRGAAEEPAEPVAEIPEPLALEEPDESADDVEDGVEDDDDEAGRRRRRRGRRGRGRGKGPTDEGEEPADAEASADGDEPEPETEDEETEDEGDGVTRRRRRRRRKGSGEAESGGVEDGVHTVVRVREPRRSDEVQGVSGSTRLEAKRQRRRDGREQRRTRPPILSESEFLARREAVDRVMVVRQKPDRTQIAVLEDGVLVEHYVSRSTSGTMVGNVYLGKVQNVLPSMEAAFVDVGRGRNAVLYAGEVNWDATGLEGRARSIEQALRSGDSVLVQVTKDPIGHKGARLSSHIALSGRHLVYVPNGNASGISRKLPDNERKRLRDVLKKMVPDGAGVIVRTAAEGASEDELARDVKRLQAQWEDIQAKSAAGHAPAALSEEPDLVIRVVRDLFNEDFREVVIQGEQAYGEVENYLESVSPELVERLHRYTGTHDIFADKRIDEQILKGLDRKVFLPSGGHLVIDRTEAMTVVDVNTGKYTGAGGNLEETVTRNNLEAAEEIVRQLRLRDIGGIVVIDFIDMVLESNRDLVLRRLTECLGRDRTKHQVTEITSLGLVQMTRKRIGAGLLEAFTETCDHCKGRGLVIHTEPVPEKRQFGAVSQVKAVAAAGQKTEPQPVQQQPAAGQQQPAGKSRRRRGGAAAEVAEAPPEAVASGTPTSGTTASGTTASGTTASGTTASGTTASGTTAFGPADGTSAFGTAASGTAVGTNGAAGMVASGESPVAAVAEVPPPVTGSGIVGGGTPVAAPAAAGDDDYDISGYDLSRYAGGAGAEPMQLTGADDPDAADDDMDDDEPVGAGAGRRRSRRGGTRRRTRP